MVVRRILMVASAVASMVSAAACSGAGVDGNSVAITVDSSAGYPVVRSAGAAERWTAELVATLGPDSSGESTFGTVRSVLLDSSGAAYVLDPSYRQIHVFGPEGRLRARWGRKGEGPGEFSMPYALAWLDGALAVQDPGIPRISLLGTEGEWLSQWMYERITGGQQVRLYRTPPRGFWAYHTQPTSEGKLQTVLVRYSASGPTDSMVVFRPPQGFVGARCDQPDRGIYFFTPPFGARPMALPTADGEQVVATSTEYRIAFLGEAHDTLRVIERPVEPEPVSEAEWEAGLQEFRDYRAREPKAHCDRTSWDRPRSKPVIESMFVDDEQMLWVEVLTANGRVYDVFGADGRLRANVEGLPPSNGIDPSVVAGRVAIVVKDSLDVQSVQVFRLRKP